jgi:hypothetical protein
MIWEWIYVFVAIFAADVFWTLYIQKVQESRPVAAGLWAVALFIPGALVTLSYVREPILLIPACLGAFTGTYCTIWWTNRRKLKKAQ